MTVIRLPNSTVFAVVVYVSYIIGTYIVQILVSDH